MYAYKLITLSHWYSWQSPTFERGIEFRFVGSAWFLPRLKADSLNPDCAQEAPFPIRPQAEGHIRTIAGLALREKNKSTSQWINFARGHACLTSPWCHMGFVINRTIWTITNLSGSIGHETHHKRMKRCVYLYLLTNVFIWICWQIIKRAYLRQN